MTVEVKTKLTLDGNAHAEQERLIEGFKELHENAEKAHESFSELKMALAEIVGEELREGIERAKEFAESFVEVADEGERQMTRVGGLITAVQGKAWGEAAEAAERYEERVADVALNVQTPIEETKEAFAKLVEIQGATPEGLERSEHQIEQMATLARVLGTNIEAVSSQFAFMEEGAIKVKSQMFQLLQPTGIFEHQGMKATEYWSKLTNESRAELLAKGLDMVSSRLAAAKPTFHDTLTELQNFEVLAKERFGEGLTRAIGPAVEQLNRYLERNTGKVDQLADEMAVHVKDWVDEAVKDIQEGFQYLENHGAEIKEDLKEAWSFAKQVFDYILAHKEVLAIKWLAGTELGKGAIGLGNQALNLGKSVYGVGAAEGTSVAGAEFAAGLSGGVVALGAFGLAIAGVTAALYEYKQVMAITGGGKSEERMDYEAIQKRFQEMIRAPDMAQWGGAEIEHFNHMRAEITRLAEDIGESSAAAGALADQAYAAHRAVRGVLDPVDQAARALADLAGAGGDKDWAAQDAAVGQITAAFQAAAEAHNVGEEQYVANLLAGSESLQTAFLQSASMSAEGFGALADMLQTSAKEFAEKLRQKADLTGDLKKEIKPQMNFNGGQTFKINQDFRDQDPDRVFLAFRDDVQKAAVHRAQSSFSSPFGV